MNMAIFYTPKKNETGVNIQLIIDTIDIVEEAGPKVNIGKKSSNIIEIDIAPGDGGHKFSPRVKLNRKGAYTDKTQNGVSIIIGPDIRVVNDAQHQFEKGFNSKERKIIMKLINKFNDELVELYRQAKLIRPDSYDLTNDDIKDIENRMNIYVKTII